MRKKFLEEKPKESGDYWYYVQFVDASPIKARWDNEAQKFFDPHYKIPYSDPIHWEEY